ncbi:MAG: MerR family DNA-binding protein, partial [Pirellulaceae bacterium]|nr:MerR family DNA-binding protein [Pirellulaceae bacterium]
MRGDLDVFLLADFDQISGAGRVSQSRRDRARLRLILRGKRLGFSLSDIGEMLDLYDVDGDQREQMRMTLRKSRERLKALRQQRRDIDDAIGELQDACRQIEAMLA